jgi:alkanesulfonate monooxygenase SsuD/methylene tetrahydromethanopterin reductase-like flavin-dependent oxidoreductase (luciferase family)
LPDKRIRYGVYLPPFGPFGDPAVLVELAVRAEAAGWDGVFLWDHVVTEAMPIVDCWSTLAAIATATERVLLGPMVTPLARRRPWIVARQAATVSRLSAGRLVFGAGLGSDESGDFSRFGDPVDPGVRAELLDEGLAVAEAMWAGRAYRSARIDIAETEPNPYPIPVWLASTTGRPQVLRRAARHDGIFPNPESHTPRPEEVADLVAAVRAAGPPADRPFDVAVPGNASQAWPEQPRIDLAGLAEAGMTWWMESLIHFDPLDLSLRIVDAGPPRA